MIAHEQEFELYHYAESLCSQKARIGMAEKQVPYKSNHIFICDVAEECQNLDDAYLKVNPKGIVPTLVHNGKPVYDAHRIIRYVDEQFLKSGTRLWPQDESGQSFCNYWFTEGMLDETAAPGSTFGLSIPLLSHPILSYLLQRQPADLVIEKFKNHPIERRGKNFTNMRLHGTKPPPEVLNDVYTSLAKGLIALDRQLEKSGGPFLLSEFTLPDITMMACFHRLEDVRLDDVLSHAAVPKLAGYWERLQARSSYKEGVIDWHDDVNWRPALPELFGDKSSPRLDAVMSKITEVVAAH